MNEAVTVPSSIATMPRGGPRASWLDRRLQTNALEFLDRDDVPDELRQRVIAGLDVIGTRLKQHENNARAALGVVVDVPEPRILELGAGHGKLSAKIVEYHRTATLTVSDVDPASVANIAASEIGSHPRVTTQVVDASAIDAPDDSYDLVVFAMSFHHLPPAAAFKAIAEATRVGKRFLVIDLKRQSVWAQLLPPVYAAPMIAMMPLRTVWPVMHDGFISGLRAYSRAALEALGRAVDPQMRIEFLSSPGFFGLTSATVVYSRPI